MKLLRLIATLTFLSAMTLTACNNGNSPPPPDRMTIQLSGPHSVEFSGYHVANWEGFYSDEGLDVYLSPGNEDVDPITQVLEGQADFGLTSAMSFILARNQGDKLVAVAALYRRSPLALMALSSSGIATPADLRKKKIGILSGKSDAFAIFQLMDMVEQMGIDRQSVLITSVENSGLESLTSGEADAVLCWVTKEVAEARVKGQDVNVIMLGDYGVQDYPNLLFTKEQTVKEKPELVERVVRATLKGYQYAVEHPEKATQITLFYDNALNKDLQTYSMKTQVPLINTGDAPIGQMDDWIWRDAQDVLVRQSIMGQPLDLDTLYTNQFVEKAHSPVANADK